MIYHILIIVIAFLLMEFIAWFSHKFIMHGFLWNLHKEHHAQNHHHFFEKNDLFFLIFATPSWLGIMFGAIHDFDYKFYAGIGILIYGIAYFIVHDVIIHQRFKWFNNSKNWYINGIKKAHKIHHKKFEKQAGENFGMLMVPLKYFKKETKNVILL